jgi:hypothetical protein
VKAYFMTMLEMKIGAKVFDVAPRGLGPHGLLRGEWFTRVTVSSDCCQTSLSDDVWCPYMFALFVYGPLYVRTLGVGRASLLL